MIRTAFRSLLKTPLFTSLVVATLALGIGANTATFSVWKAIALNPLPYADADRLVTIAETDGRTVKAESVAYGTLPEFQRRSESFDQLCLWGDGMLRPMRQGQVDLWRGMQVNYYFFDLLGVKMLLGRKFAREDNRPNTANKLILSYPLWTRYFGGDPKILGRAIPMAGDSTYTVIGVLQAEFHPLHMSNAGEIPQFYMPPDLRCETSGCAIRAAGCGCLGN